MRKSKKKLMAGKKGKTKNEAVIEAYDAMCRACEFNRTRLQKLLESPKTDIIEKPLIEQRIANMTTVIEIYTEKKKALGCAMRKFEVVSPFKPAGDQGEAVVALAEGIKAGDKAGYK